MFQIIQNKIHKITQEIYINISSTLKISDFRKIIISSTFFSLALWTERIAVGWIFISETESVSLTILSFAVRQLPLMLFAPFSGTFSDRLPIKKILFTVGIFQFIVIFCLAFILENSTENYLLIYILIFFSGIGHAFIQPSTQKAYTDSVPKNKLMSAVSTGSVFLRGIGFFSVMIGTILFKYLGASITLYSVGAIYLLGSINSIILLRSFLVKNYQKKNIGFFLEVKEGFSTILNISLLRTLLILALIVEIFGFVFHSILPAAAQKLLNTDVIGYGSLASMAALGSLVGTIVLMILGDYKYKNKLLIYITFLYGILISVFSFSSILVVGSLIIFGVGACAAMFDSMQWTILQSNVPSNMKGRAIGMWGFIIGFGLAGHIIIGMFSDFIGIRQTLLFCGISVCLSGLLFLFYSKRYKEK